MSLTIDELDLSPVAKAAACALQQTCPFVVFTSGRRSLKSQADAMAENSKHDRRWISKVYIHAAELQTWLDTHPEAGTTKAIAEGLYSVLEGLPPEEVSKISRHLTGDAFDVQPLTDDTGAPTPDGVLLIAAMRQLAGLEKILLKEGGLVRWHAQFYVSNGAKKGVTRGRSVV